MSVANGNRVILDVDAGADDAMALLIFFYAMKIGMVKIEAIICTNGNTGRENVVKNVVRILEATGNTNIPVYRGSIKPIIPPTTPPSTHHGKDGFGDIKWPKEPDTSIVRDTPGTVAMYELVKGNPNEITIIALAPVTNIALATRLYDDFLDNVKDIWIMGGNYKGVGNTDQTAEFNFLADPEAAYLLLNETNKPIHLLPWEACNQFATTVTWDWRSNVLGKSSIPAMQMITQAEKNFHRAQAPKWVCCDGLLATCYLFPHKTIIHKNDYRISVELHGSQTRGQVTMFRKRITTINAHIIENVNHDYFKKVLLEVGGLSEEL